MSLSTRIAATILSAAAITSTVTPAASAFDLGSLGTSSLPGISIPVPSPGGVEVPSQSDPVKGDYAAIRAEMVELTNAERARRGVPPLVYMTELETIAMNWSQQMADEGKMYHNPDVRSQYPSNWSTFGENVLQNWRNASAETLIAQWRDSPGHYASMINPRYTHIGIGYAVTAQGKVYATQNFGSFR